MMFGDEKMGFVEWDVIEIEEWRFWMWFCGGRFVVMCEVVVYVVCELLGEMLMVEKLEYGLGVLEVDREEVRVVIDRVRVKGFMKGFLNFERVSFVKVGGKFRVKG